MRDNDSGILKKQINGRATVLSVDFIADWMAHLYSAVCIKRAEGGDLCRISSRHVYEPRHVYTFVALSIFRGQSAECMREAIDDIAAVRAGGTLTVDEMNDIAEDQLSLWRTDTVQKKVTTTEKRQTQQQTSTGQKRRRITPTRLEDDQLVLGNSAFETR